MKNVQDIYGLSPMQELMLLHSVSRISNDTLFNQFCYRIDSPVDVDAFRVAWQGVVQRHATLRTAFFWENVKQPVQVVRQHLDVDIAILDWRERDPAAVKEDFSEFCSKDRATGFDLQRAPLLRLTLIQHNPDAWFLVWSSHHLILDRWCLDTIYSDFDTLYRVALKLQEPDNSVPVSFREYINWIQRQDREAARNYWSSALAGFQKPNQLVNPAGKEIYLHESITLATPLLDELKQCAKRNEVSLSTLLQGAWALVINRITGSQDVVFGATVAGRPPEIEDVEGIVGSFVNNLPVRARLCSQTTIKSWLKELQSIQFRRSSYEYFAQQEIIACSDLEGGGALFDSLFVWLSSSAGPRSPALPMEPFGAVLGTAYPFTLSVQEAAGCVVIHADCRQQPLHSLQHILQQLEEIVAHLSHVATPDSTGLGELPGFKIDRSFKDTFVTVGAESKAAPLRRKELPAPDGGAHGGRERVSLQLMLELVQGKWQYILGQADVPLDQDFFDLGGSSLQATQLHLDIESSTRQSVPLLALFRNPTVRGMATALVNEDWPLLASMAQALRSSRNGVPLFCIASPEVSTIGYSLLARYLSKRYSIYVLQSPPESERVRKMDPSELPRFGEQYLDAMREIQPVGPYRMLGMCGGAHISIEIARHLDAAGEKTAFLGIINTWGLYTVTKLYYPYRLFRIGKYYGERVSQLIWLQRKSAKSPEQLVEPPVATPLSVSPAEPAGDDPDPKWFTEVGFAELDPLKPKVSCEATVYRLRRHNQQFWRIWDAGLGWFKQVDKVRVMYIPGKDHKGVLREQGARVIAEDINNDLETTGSAIIMSESGTSITEGQVS